MRVYSGSTIIFANASLGTILQLNRLACEGPVVPRYRFEITTPQFFRPDLLTAANRECAV
jgi:hypothetical protein